MLLINVLPNPRAGQKEDKRRQTQTHTRSDHCEKQMTIVLWILIINVQKKKRVSHAIVSKLIRPRDPLCYVILDFFK